MNSATGRNDPDRADLISSPRCSSTKAALTVTLSPERSGALNGQVFKNTLHHRVEPPRANILDRLVHLGSYMSQRADAVLGEVDHHLLGPHQGGILQGQGVVGFGQDADEILFGQGAQLDPDRQATLEFWQQVRRFGDVERTRGDEQDMIGFDRPVLGRKLWCPRSAAASRAALPHG